VSGFVHLRLHSEYSLVDSVVRVPELMAAARQAGLPALALTDASNLFGLVQFYASAEKAGIKPLIGCDLAVHEEEGGEPSRLTLLCMDGTGYRNLVMLVTRAWRDGQRLGVPGIARDWLRGHSAGLIALSGGAEGDVGRALLAERHAQAERALTDWLALFPDRYYLEVARLGRREDETHLAAAVRLAARHAVPVVAVNDVCFLAPDDFGAHEARVCIQQGRTLDDPRRPRRHTAQQYLRSPTEMATLFADLPEALANTVEVARRCNLTLELDKPRLPAFPLPDSERAEDRLRADAERGLAARLARAGVSDATPYRTRLEVELGVISGMGFAGYYLIVADFIAWARANGVPVGPGRGSGAGSLAAWALGITDLDPLAYDLLFERFLNPERVSLPDFDIDFCVEGRDRVVEYVAQRYGRDAVAQIVTYQTMGAKAVVRDVGRVLGHPYGFVDRIAKTIPAKSSDPDNPKVTLDMALEHEPEFARLYAEEDEVRAIVDLARELEDLARAAGRHAAGVIIAPGPITEFVALYQEQDSEQPVTQLEMGDAEKMGLVKFDFLGLATVTIIHRAVRIVNAARAGRGEAALDIDALPLDDAATFRLLKRGETTGVFQLESRGMKDLLRRLQPDRFEDITAVNALFRPGPLTSGMVDDFIERKHGRKKVEYPHPVLAKILEPTYGVFVYQEQVMQAAQAMAGYSLGGADLLRRAMGKKKAEEMAKQRDSFVSGALAAGVAPDVATHVFDLMAAFAGYGFNKSHAAAYALLAYQTAWLKAHHPAAFMAAVLTVDMQKTDKVVTLIHECRDMGLAVLAPDVNRSQWEFAVVDGRTILYGLGAIRGVGESVVSSVTGERERGGLFRDLDDFCRRVDLTRLNRRVLEVLIKAGALDALGPNRASLMAHLPQALGLAEQAQRAAATGQDDLFGLAPTPVVGGTLARIEERPEWDARDLLAAEKETLGLYLSGHPIDRYQRDLGAVASARIGTLTDQVPDAAELELPRYKQPQRQVAVAGLVVDVRRRPGRTSIMLDDGTGRLEATLFEDGVAQFGHLLAMDEVVVAEGRLGFDEFINGWRLTIKDLRKLEDVRARVLRRIQLTWPAGAGPAFVTTLKAVLEPFRGGRVLVGIDYPGAGARGVLTLGEAWRVRPTDELLTRLDALVGPDGLVLEYGPRLQVVA
jgi:DNA polymerase-3 subunit alpha